ncbi:MAG: carboxypeptidase-like regulatory domain-containing protein, partial [Chitinophagaceae bacterium]
MMLRKLILLTGCVVFLLSSGANAQTGTIQFEPVPDSLSRLIDSLVSVADSFRDHGIIQTPDSSGVISIVPSDSILKTATAGYELRGVVKDRNTGEGIPFATVFFAGTPTGTAADIDGNFILDIKSLPKDTLSFQAIGYQVGKRRLDRTKNKYSLIIELERAENMLAEFVLRPGEDPAVTLLKQIIERKPFNNPDRSQNYKYEVYNKLEVDLERLSREQFEKLPVPFMKQFSFIYDNLDTTSDEDPFLPVYFTETLSDYYFQRNPKKAKEFIRASQVKGIKNESITKFMGSMYQNLNAYDNFIPVFDKEFVSPISNQGLFYYKYKIKDTQEAYGHKIILVQFVPKRKGENCFTGDFWVVDSVYALQRINMKVPKDANINWVRRVDLYQEYAPVTDSIWFCVKDKFIADFAAPYNVKLPGFIGRKTTSYRDILINDPAVSKVVNDPKLRQDIIVADTARHASDAFWAGVRHDSLSKNEKAIYRMMDTLESMPVFTTYKNTIKFLATGTKEFGPIELGPIWNMYNRNPIEGHRFRFSMGTTPKLFKDIYLNGYIAYGTKDERFKYKATGLWLLNRHPRMYIYGSHIYDIDRSTSYYDAVSNDNIFANLVRKPGIPWKLAFTTDTRIEFFKEYFSGFSHMLSLIHRNFSPYDPLPDINIFQNEAGFATEDVTSTEINLRLRFAYKEQFLEGNYYRVSLGTKYPVVDMRLGLGIKDFLNSGYSFKKASVSISDEAKISPFGSLYYNLFAGKYFGILPYPLLEVHPGNEFRYYNKYAFNMMNRFEFLSDQYVGLNLEHTIGNGIFTYIPLLKKAKLRQFWTAKVLYGDLSDDNKALNLNKGFPFRTLDKIPYVELG